MPLLLEQVGGRGAGQCFGARGCRRRVRHPRRTRSRMSYDPMTALAIGNDKRMMNAELRARIYRRDITLPDLFRDPPASIEALLVIDVCRWATESRRASVGLRKL